MAALLSHYLTALGQQYVQEQGSNNPLVGRRLVLLVVESDNYGRSHISTRWQQQRNLVKIKTKQDRWHSEYSHCRCSSDADCVEDDDSSSLVSTDSISSMSSCENILDSTRDMGQIQTRRPHDCIPRAPTRS
jgi:hypothetical protein